MTRDEIMALDMDEIDARREELRGLIEQDGADLDAIEAEVEAINERRAQLIAEREERKADAAAVAEGAGMEIETEKENRTMDLMEIRKSPEYIEAFANYIKTGKDKEVRALLTENASGGIPVPVMVEDRIRTAWERDGITSRVRKSYLKGNLKVGFEISASGATVHTEGGAAVDPETLVTGIVTLVPSSIKKIVEVSDEALDMHGPEFLNYIYDELTYQIAKKAADELIGKIKAAGTASTTTAVGIPEIESSTVSVGLVAQALGSLSDEATDPVVIMNKATWSEFKAAQYAASYPVDPFEGLDVVFNNTVTAFSAATTGLPWLIVGDLDKGALMNFPNGNDIEFRFDDLSKAAQDLVRIIGREYVGIGVVGPGQFVKVVMPE